MGQFGDIAVSKGGDAVLVHGVQVRLLAMLVSDLGMLKRLSGTLMPGLAILFLMGFRGAAMRVGGEIVQLGRSLVILVMRSVVVTRGHYRLTISHDLARATSLSCARGWPFRFARRCVCGMALARRIRWNYSGGGVSQRQLCTLG